MKKFYLGIVFLCFAVGNLWAVNVSVTMNATSPTMSLVKKDGGAAVAVGDPVSRAYTFETAPGTYVLTGYDAAGVNTGTIELNIEESTELVEIKIVTISAWVTNTHEDRSLWAVGTDYTIPEDEIVAASREGVRRVITAGQRTVSNNVQTTFQMLVGDTYTVYYYPTELHSEFMSIYRAATMTSQTGNASLALVAGLEYTITIPQEATLFVGSKTLTHYVPFKKVEPVKVETAGGKSVYTFKLASGKQTYNYRVNMEGAMPHAGKFGYSDQYPKYELEITKEEMLEHGDADFFDHNVKSNSFGNVSDILLNINERGHLRLDLNEQFQIVNQRSWQLIDDQSNNYFVEPDYHYTVLNDAFQENSAVVTVDANGLLKAVGKGTAIVQVRYDALYAWEYNRVDAFGNYGKDLPFWFSAKWSCLWAENVGTFVVTVGENEDPNLKPNFEINTELQERLKENPTIDSELDVFYYFEDQPGYNYTFTPEGVSKVEVANPAVDTIQNTLTYPNGFSTENVQKVGDTYKVLLTYGRNIIRLTSSSGATVYQVISAKPIGYEIKNSARPGEDIYPGDSVIVQFHGLFHPSLKLSGIYNQSAYIYYNNTPNGTSLILGPNQYNFAGNPDAQAYKTVVPSAWSEENYKLDKGSLYVKGFGSAAGKHRGIDRVAGVNPNFTADVTAEYWGAIPSVSIPIKTPVNGFKFTGLPEGAEIIAYNTKNLKDTLLANAQGEYVASYLQYSYEIYADNYKTMLGSHTITEGSGIVEIPISMEAITATEWDGVNMLKPKQVTAQESATSEGEFENMEGYYKITNGYELRWIAFQTEQENSDKNVVLVNDIDFNKKAWSPIGPASAKVYSGVFEGNNKTIKNLLINNSSYAFFGYVNGGTVRNLTTEGEVTSGKAAMFVILTGTFYVDNCHNKANVKGGQGTGGLVGQINPTVAASVIKNSSNSGNVNSGSSMYAGGFAGQITTGSGIALTIENCWNSGTVSSTSGYLGGFSGSLTSATAVVLNCYNTGAISAKGKNIGGLAGYATGGTIKNSFNVGTITNASVDNIGAIKGDNTAASIVNCYAPDNLGAKVTAGGAALKPVEAFGTGEVAWLLGDAFGQEIGKDLYPVFDGQPVYQAAYTSNYDKETAYVYTNGVLPEIMVEGYEGEWYTGKEGVTITSISEDSELYVKFIDNVAPTQPANLIATPKQNNIVVTWEASHDDFGVTGYNIYVNEKFKEATTETMYDVTGLQAAAEYTIEVEAFDAAGNKSEKASTTAATIDETAPTAPTNLKGVPAETSIELSWTASTDNVAVTGYNVYVNETFKESVTGTSYTLSGLTVVTEYTIEVEAFDAAGNKSTKASATVSTIDETAPTVPTELLMVDKTKTTIELSWSASTDNVAVEGYNIYLDGAYNKSVTETTAVIEGLTARTEYTIEMEAYDAAGNKSAKASIMVKTLSEGSSLSMIESDLVRVYLYPNPVVSELYITCKEGAAILLYDSNGRKVNEVKSTSSQTMIDMSSLNNGVYILMVNKERVKIIKQ